MGLNLFAYSDYELIEGAIITLYAKAYGIGGGYLSPFFFFWGIASVGFSLNKGSAAKYAISLVLGERFEINLILLICGNFDYATCPPFYWLKKILFPSFYTTWTIPAIGWTIWSYTFSEIIERGENTLQNKLCLKNSPSFSYC